jgi:hypothetical protein
VGNDVLQRPTVDRLAERFTDQDHVAGMSQKSLCEVLCFINLQTIVAVDVVVGCVCKVEVDEVDEVG